MQTHGTEDINVAFAELFSFYLQNSELETTLEDDIAYVESTHGVTLQEVSDEPEAAEEAPAPKAKAKTKAKA